MSTLPRAPIKYAALILNRAGLSRVNRLARKLLERAGGGTVTIQVDGFQLKAPLVALRTIAQIDHGDYEASEVALFKTAVQPGYIVVDVGAHVGYYSLIAARGVGREGHVFAFEPDPRTAPYLKLNIESNGFANVDVVTSAASDHVGTRPMYLAANANRSSLYESSTLDGVEEVTSVSAVPVDSILSGKQVDVVKVDAEGLRACCLSRNGTLVEILHGRLSGVQSGGVGVNRRRRCCVRIVVAREIRPGGSYRRGRRSRHPPHAGRVRKPALHGRRPPALTHAQLSVET